MARSKKQRVHTIDSSELFDEDGGAVPVENVGSTKVPCSIQGITSGLGGGVLGYVFGFGRTLLTTRKLKALHAAGVESGTTFAVFGGVYAAALCFCSRIRQKDDFWNGGLAGCATGVVVAWKGGPVSALQSCIGIGVLSAVFDVIGKEPTAEACPLSIYDKNGAVLNQRSFDKRKKGPGKRRIGGKKMMAVADLSEAKKYAKSCRQCRPGFWFLR